MERYAQLLTILKTENLRLTQQRMAICRLLADSKEHPTAQMIFDDLRRIYPSLSRATVYNTLNVLVKAGGVDILGEAGDNAIHYDADTDPHVNLACLRCHRVIDFPSEHIDQVVSEVQLNSGYRLLGARVLYYGLCPDCQAETEMIGA